jgi:hypothetical protein
VRPIRINLVDFKSHEATHIDLMFCLRRFKPGAQAEAAAQIAVDGIESENLT